MHVVVDHMRKNYCATPFYAHFLAMCSSMETSYKFCMHHTTTLLTHFPNKGAFANPDLVVVCA